MPGNAEAIRQALQCARPSCRCHAARGRLHCPAHDDATPDLSLKEKNGVVLELLLRRPWRVIGPSEAVLFRKIDRDSPEVLVDEVDTIFNSKNPATEGLKQIILAGYRRGAMVPRCVPDGKSVTLKDFKVF